MSFTSLQSTKELYSRRLREANLRRVEGHMFILTGLQRIVLENMFQKALMASLVEI